VPFMPNLAEIIASLPTPEEEVGISCQALGRPWLAGWTMRYPLPLTTGTYRTWCAIRAALSS
jgi:hypothetical protein